MDKHPEPEEQQYSESPHATGDRIGYYKLSKFTWTLTLFHPRVCKNELSFNNIKTNSSRMVMWNNKNRLPEGNWLI